jgi:hypothetical protein
MCTGEMKMKLKLSFFILSRELMIMGWDEVGVVKNRTFNDEMAWIWLMRSNDDKNRNRYR